MSIVELLNANESEIEFHAKKIRARIDELLLRLETTFLCISFSRSAILSAASSSSFRILAGRSENRCGVHVHN